MDLDKTIHWFSSSFSCTVVQSYITKQNLLCWMKITFSLQTTNTHAPLCIPCNTKCNSLVFHGFCRPSVLLAAPCSKKNYTRIFHISRTPAFSPFFSYAKKNIADSFIFFNHRGFCCFYIPKRLVNVILNKYKKNLPYVSAHTP